MGESTAKMKDELLLLFSFIFQCCFGQFKKIRALGTWSQNSEKITSFIAPEVFYFYDIYIHISLALTVKNNKIRLFLVAIENFFITFTSAHYNGRSFRM